MDYFDNMFSYLQLGFCTISVFAQYWHSAYALAPLKSIAGEAMHPLAPTASIPLGLHDAADLYCTVMNIQYILELSLNLLLSLQLVN